MRLPGPVTKPVAAVKLALKCLAQRHQLLTTELATLDRDLEAAWIMLVGRCAFISIAEVFPSGS